MCSIWARESEQKRPMCEYYLAEILLLDLNGISWAPKKRGRRGLKERSVFVVVKFYDGSVIINADRSCPSIEW